ncbi:hypothetical protein ACFV2X_42900 [Streptomyces sp. NPDC059679]|uniref:hypothetical protein n=1 Tax=Streptomyces sp. NPDC059679 TaxID=3346903 RepID=UPI0036A85EEF
MSDELWKLLRETAEVQRMIEALRHSDQAGTTTPEQEREYLLRRAVLAQRHLAAAELTGSDPADAASDAQRTALTLWEHDALHGSTGGPIQATDLAWNITNVREYVRQEAVEAERTQKPKE